MFNFINPSFLYIAYGTSKKITIDNVSINYSLNNTKRHIDNALTWIVVNQEIQNDNGLPGTISFFFSKIISSRSFPEVTGYIINTLFDYAKYFDSNKCYEAALRSSEFEINLQNSEGSFPEGDVGSHKGPSVFNSGQIVHGLIRAFNETGDDKYLQSCIKACNWIVKVQGSDGSWGSFNYRNIKRTYDSKVSESLLEVAQITKNTNYIISAKRNLEFVITNQKDNGWFYNCDNTIERNDSPLLHLIGYTLEGLLNSYLILNENDYLKVARKTLDKLMHKFEIDKRPLSGRFYSDWRPASKSYCVTGLAQISLCWGMLYEITNDYRYLNSFLKMNDILKSMQIFIDNKYLYGSIPGSYPFWGDYNSYGINSWGVKYYADALIKEYNIKNNLLLNN